MSEFRRTVAESLLVGAILLPVALGANALYADGLEILGRDYFRPSGPAAPVNGAETPPPPDVVDGVDAGASPAEGPVPAPVDAPPTDEEIRRVEERLRAEGLLPISHDEVAALFDDPIYQDGAFVFVDARNDQHFEAGHIPGAYQFDHFRMERYVNEVVPACKGALQVVVYCYGMDCSDSEIATKHLRNFGVDPSMLFVYVPGIQGWCGAGRQVERGPRGSGELGKCDS